LRRRDADLKCVLDTFCARIETAESRNESSPPGAIRALAGAGQQLPDLLAISARTPARMGPLAAAARELASLEEYDAVAAAVPRLALAICGAGGARLLRLREGATVETLASSGAALSLADAALADRVRQAVAGGGALERPTEGSVTALPVGPRDGGLALVVERASPRARIAESDLEQLGIFATVAAVSLLHAASRAALREAAARDDATLGAIGDGVLATDRTGTVRSLNQAAASAMGVKREDAIGRRLRELPGLSALASALTGVPTGVEVVPLPRSEMVVHRHGYEGGMVAILRDLATEHTISKRAVGSTARFTFERLVGKDPAFLELLETARRAAPSNLPILVTGESGTGKELLAQAIHNASGRASAPFIGVNVTAIPRELVESELFGYESGTFTGARSSGMAGKFELAGRGTLLLDELGDMPLEIQGKLLRVLQERVVQRLGSVADVQVRARVIATTHRNLDEAVANGHFRLDLYHRLRVVHLRIPPLRERRGDILPIAEAQLEMHAQTARRRPIRLSPSVVEALQAYDWPGNVRELCNVIESEASLLPGDEDVISRVPRTIVPATPQKAERVAFADGILPLEELERRACSEALDHFEGNVARAAQALGLAKTTMYAKMKKYGLGGRASPSRD
jgi:sigma-54 dependent transcriptional regulator, acetoin dehydrogenase operon transcriptional activator AcoR